MVLTELHFRALEFLRRIGQPFERWLPDGTWPTRYEGFEAHYTLQAMEALYPNADASAV